jgi:hypothetical protein
MEYAPTAHNGTIYASPPGGGPVYDFARSFRYAPSHGSFHPHFASPDLCFAKPLFGLAHLTYSRNVM